MPMSTTWASKISGDLVAHEVVHRLHVELGGEALLDAVDDRQLGGALVGLRQQALRLVEQPRVLEGDAHAAASVESSRTSASLKAWVCRGSGARWTPNTRSPVRDRGGEHRLWSARRPQRTETPASRCPRRRRRDRSGRAGLENVRVEPGTERTWLDGWSRVRRRSIAVRERDQVRRRVEMAMSISRRRRSRRILSPTGRTSPGCRAARPAPCWTLVDDRQLGVRCSLVSVSSRCVSSNSRAFSSATLRLDGEGRQQADVGLARTRPRVEVLERDHAGDRRRRRPERDEESGLRNLAGQDRRHCRTASPRRTCRSIDQHGCRVSSTCLPEADDADADRRGSARRARSCTGNGAGPWPRSSSAMSTTWASKISWILSPTSSYIACMSSFAARPSWTLLMIASSAARSLVSVSSRFVSSNRRAFSRATLVSRRGS